MYFPTLYIPSVSLKILIWPLGEKKLLTPSLYYWFLEFSLKQLDTMHYSGLQVSKVISDIERKVSQCPSASLSCNPKLFLCVSRGLARVNVSACGRQRTKEEKVHLKEKRGKQWQQLSYVINLPPRWILAPTWLCYDSGDLRRCEECDRVRVCLQSPAAEEQDICRMLSGRVREVEIRDRVDAHSYTR